MNAIKRPVGIWFPLSVVLYLSLFSLLSFQTADTKWLNISVSIERKGRAGDCMKKVFLAESIRLSNWSAVISANDAPGAPLRQKGPRRCFVRGSDLGASAEKRVL